MLGILASIFLLAVMTSIFILYSIAIAVCLTIPSYLAQVLGDAATFGIAKKLRHLFASTVAVYPMGLWLYIVSNTLCRFLGIRLVAHFNQDSKLHAFDRIRATFDAQRMLLISNHPTTLDWMFLWTLFACVNNPGRIKICLKQSIARVPILGWTMQSLPYVFLARRRFKQEQVRDKELPAKPTEELPKVDDIQTIRTSMRHFNKYPPYVVLLFPEGTDLSVENRQRSHVFSKEKGLPKFDYVLIPRKRGFTAFVEEFPREGSKLVDVTMAYVGYVPGETPSEKTVFLQSRPPREVHFLIEQADFERDDSKIEEQLRCTFERKEKWLHAFHTEGPPSGGVDCTAMLAIWPILTVVIIFSAIGCAFYYYFSLMALLTVLASAQFLICDTNELVLRDVESGSKAA